MFKAMAVANSPSIGCAIIAWLLISLNVRRSLQNGVISVVAAPKMKIGSGHRYSRAA